MAGNDFFPRRGSSEREERRWIDPPGHSRVWLQVQSMCGLSPFIHKAGVAHFDPRRWLPGLLAFAAVPGLSCSGGGGSDPGITTPVGVLVAKPGGGYFLADSHRRGSATRIRLLEIGWGRLVDVHDVDAQGRTNPVPVLRDIVINENVLGDGVDSLLETNPITHDSRLVVLRPRDAPDTGTGTFTSIVRRSTASLAAVLPKKDDGTATLPISLVARNATFVLRFDDLLEDGPEAREALRETVRLTSGYPPIVPQPARIVFDPSHGGVVDGAFHSTRVLIDCSVSERDSLDMPFLVPVNAAGLPASSSLSAQPNGSIHLPTRIDPLAGRFVRLTNLAGRWLETGAPSDPATGDIVRAFRSGNPADSNAGFLLDLLQPSIISDWELALTEAADDPVGPLGHAFVVDLSFQTPCRSAPRVGDTLELFGELYEVREQAGPPDVDGRVANVRLLRLEEEPLGTPASLLGLGRFSTQYEVGFALQPSCWVNFLPEPGQPPSNGIETDVRVRVRFNEPMDPETFRAFDTFRMLRGAESDDDILAADLIVGVVRVEQNLQEFSFVPRLPLANHSDLDYRIELFSGPTGVRDLSGSPLADSFTRSAFRLAAGQPPQVNGGFGMRFATNDELLATGSIDLRGQVSYDEDRGVLRPRPVSFTTYSADRGIPLVNLMRPWAFGVQTPLSPLGSKVQAIWRYCDFGFRVRDEGSYNLDVIGLSWSPLGGALVADLFPHFEMRLAHANCVPDETILSSLAPKYPTSGLVPAPSRFTENLLQDPRGAQVVVHSRTFGYQIRPADLTQNGRGTPLMPFPWNRSNAPFTTYTWRDTTLATRAGLTCPGVPLDIEVGGPLNIDNTGIGSAAPTGQIPSFALSLLWEIRCFPTAGGLGLNALDILLPVPGFPQPNFRAYSTGGVDQTGRLVLKDPELELVPSGGFNAFSSPPGQPTLFNADNTFYVGSIDTVVRVSRAITVWIDTLTIDPRFVDPVVEPRDQPGNSSLVVEYRGAQDFSLDSDGAPFDAALLDPYGDYAVGSVVFHGNGAWSDDIHAVDGARYVQLRFSFQSDIESNLAPELDSFGLAFEH